MAGFLTRYYVLCNKAKIKRSKYKYAIAEKYWTLVYDNQHIQCTNARGTFDNCHLLDFKSFYPRLLASCDMPDGNILHKKPRGKHCVFHKIRNYAGKECYVWDDMLKLCNKNYEILETCYMKLTNRYKKLGELILNERESHPERKKEFMIFGCFFYGHKQKYKYVENFFLGSYLYAKGYCAVSKLFRGLKANGAKMLNTATDSILYCGNVDIPQSDYPYSLKNFNKVEFRGQNNWTGFSDDGSIVEKHMGEITRREDDNE